ncbi:type II and III secretion system protein family protein [Qipengyuania sp. DGS5-3]|uniref:type II and III secretion system protein family protein n=1 Tax=Qipengyuania sp. DGS5-3 TaxID=3349632 RepID=UPI0036D2756E
MKRRLFKQTLLASLALTPLAAVPATTANAQAVVKPAGEIVLSIGRGELVNVPGSMADVFVANDQIADVQIKSQSQLFVLGKSGGETTLYASNARGDIIWSTTIRVGSNIGSIDQMLALAMPAAKIGVATMGDNTVLLTGTVANPEDAAEAQNLVEAFVGGETNVISRLRMATPLQVNLRVRFAEVSRSLVRQLGANLITADPTSGFRFGITTGRSFTPQFNVGFPTDTTALFAGVEDVSDGSNLVTSTNQGSTLGAFGSLLGLDIGSALDLAERQGLVTTLSQPNLTALSGETAEFLAGGEFPIPLSQGLGSTTVEYRDFGVSLAYTPTVLSNGRISLRVRPEVSELSSQGAVTLNGFQIPALTIRRAETTIELGSGQSFMIAGLMSNNAQSTIDKTPGAGDIPILGNLFRSTEFRRGETELVIVVTPYLVKPVSDRDIVLPTDGFHAPNDAKRVLLNRDTDGVSGSTRPLPTTKQSDDAAPSVSSKDADTAAPALTGQPRRKERTANAAAPGFSFK